MNADTLSRSPKATAPLEGLGESDLQVAAVTCEPILEVSVRIQVELRPKSSETSRLGMSTGKMLKYWR